jgi:hypothetical protein
MSTTFLLTLLSVYVLSIAIMFLIPEAWMPKDNTPDSIVREKGFYRKVFVMGGAIIIVIILLIGYLVD